MKVNSDMILDEIERMVRPHVGIWDDPFRILITAIMSTRTKDEVTDRASLKLFCIFPDVRDLARADAKIVADLIRPVGFYRTKAVTLVKAARMIEDKYHGNIPDRLEDLLQIPGVGRKVAAIVLSYGLGKDAIAVDTHVQRISNRLGLVRSKTPEKTEVILRRKIRRERWNEVNAYFVSFGKTICTPKRPKCNLCTLRNYCSYWRKHEGSR